MINKGSIEKSLSDLINSPYAGTQMDVFYKGQVILQAFNQSDAKNWDSDLLLNKEGGIILNLFFNKNKRNNKENYLRFKKSPFYKDFMFEEMNKGRVHSYSCPISKNVSTRDLANRIIEIIVEVYEIEEKEPLEILVRAFN